MQKHSPFGELIERVRQASDIVQIVGKDVELKPSGKGLVGLSPFREEKHPSFFVYPQTQSWCDFGGSGQGGDVFAYVEQKHGMKFKQAVFQLAKQAGIETNVHNDKDYTDEIEQFTERREVERLLSLAADYYHRILPTKIRDEYFKSRYGFTDDTIDSLKLGWSTGSLWVHFVDQLGIEREKALKTGLFVAFEGGRVVDLFEDRLVFPYWRGGQVVYFIGRRTRFSGDADWEKPKYKKLLTHSERFPYVSKTVGNDSFYNEDTAKSAEQLLITEGVTDCIAAMQAGIDCISPVTTRFRKRDLPKLIDLTRKIKQIVICNDSEENDAGLEGALETASALFRQGRDIRMVMLPRPKDVDKIDLNEYLKQHSTREFAELVEASPRYVQYLIEQIPKDTAKIELTPKLKPVLECLIGRSAIERDGYLDVLGKRFDLKKNTLKKLLSDTVRDYRRRSNSCSEEDEQQIKGAVVEGSDHYYTLSGEGQKERISSFKIVPTGRVIREEGDIIIGDAATDNGSMVKEILFRYEAWRSKTAFLRAISHTDMQWTGSDNNVQGVLRLLSRKEMPIHYYSETLGYLETDVGPRWVSHGLHLSPEGVAEEKIVYTDLGAEFPKKVHYTLLPQEEARALAQRILPDLTQINTSEVITPVLGWFFAAPFKPLFMKTMKHFPFLMVHGTSGSGKTSMCKDIFWRLFGVENAEPSSATQTEFAIIRLISSTNSVPVFFDEYKTKSMGPRKVDFLHRLLRRIYNGEVEERGRQDGSVRSYPLTAPIVLGGEQRPHEPAIAERMIVSSPNENTIKGQADNQYIRAYKRLEPLPLHRLAASYIQFCLGTNFDLALKESAQITKTVLDQLKPTETIPHRSRDNLQVMTFGVMMFEAFAEYLGVELPEFDLSAAFEANLEDLMDGGRGAKNALESFLEACSTLAHNDVLVNNQQYALVEGLTCLHLSSCFDRYLEHCRRTGRSPEFDDLNALRKMLKENQDRDGFVKDISKVVSMKERRVRTVAIDMDAAMEQLDIDPFPDKPNRTWGGDRSQRGTLYDD